MVEKHVMGVCLLVLVMGGLGIAFAVSAGNVGGEAGQGSVKVSDQVPDRLIGDPTDTSTVRPADIISFKGKTTTTSTYWEVGSAGHLYFATPGTLKTYVYTAELTIPAFSSCEFVAPLTIPSKFNGKPTGTKTSTSPGRHLLVAMSVM